jgi:hypothetical protein
MSDTTTTDLPRALGVTIKYGKGYEETWANFTGSLEQIRANLISYFGLESASVAEMTMHELVSDVTSMAHGSQHVIRALGGTFAGAKDAPATTTAAAPAEGTDPWGEGDKSSEVVWPNSTPVEENPVLVLIRNATDVPALQRVWAENQHAFTEAAVSAAYKARGKALTEAAAA